MAAFQQGGGGGGGGGGSQAPPPNVGGAAVQGQLQQAEVLYQAQLEELSTMGFTNRQANLRGESKCS